ncbi:MAG: hypothetical protein M1570_17120 [Chloroflexi bacterium]|nr:hypothetical protein [Chloroflexota bacterium]
MSVHSRILTLPAAAAMALLAAGCALLPAPLPLLPSATASLPAPTLAATAAPTVLVTATSQPPSSTSVIPTLSPLSPTDSPGLAGTPPGIGPTPVARRITFPAGGTRATVQGTLSAFGLDRYVLRALAGQTMMVNLTTAPSNDGLVVIFGADGVVLISVHAGAMSWSGTLPSTQDYIVDVKGGGAPASYTLQISIPPPGPPTAADDPRRISFAAGATSATVQGITATPGQDRFVLGALAGQTMSVSIASTEGPAILIIYGADGNVLISDHAGASTWSGTLPVTQDYLIDTRSVGDAKVHFTLQVTIPPIAPQPTPKRISFPPGGTTATVQSTLPVNGVDRWVLRALAGQTMTVNTSTTQGQVILIIWGVQDGDVLISDHAGATSFTGVLPSTEDYYVDVRSVGSAAAVYSMQVTIK